MKFIRSGRSAPDAIAGNADRRGLLVGAGVAGVAAIAAQVLHRSAVEAPSTVATKAPLAKGEGYRVTPHVRRYYETAKSCGWSKSLQERGSHVAHA
jgi:hypothetical protein